MLTPEEVPMDHCYRAMRAVLRLIRAEPEIGREVFCPGLATGTGRVPPADAAEQIFRAYDDWMSNREDPLQVSGDIVNTRPSGTKPR